MEELIASIYSNPEDWSVGYGGFNHVPSDLEFCVDLGGTRCRYNDLHISLWQAYRLRKAFRWWCKNAPLEQLSKGKRSKYR